MVTRPALRVVQIDENGEAQSPYYWCNAGEEHPACDELQAAKNLAVSLQRKVDNLLRDKNAERLADPKRPTIEKLHAWWQQCNTRPRGRVQGLTPDRHDEIKMLLKDHDRTVDEIMWAVLGAAKYPYYAKQSHLIGTRTDKPSRKGEPRYTDWEHIRTKAGRFEMLASLGAQWLKENGQELPDLDSLELQKSKKR
jgi:hypothetical protein